MRKVKSQFGNTCVINFYYGRGGAGGKGGLGGAGGAGSLGGAGGLGGAGSFPGCGGIGGRGGAGSFPGRGGIGGLGGTGSPLGMGIEKRWWRLWFLCLCCGAAMVLIPKAAIKMITSIYFIAMFFPNFMQEPCHGCFLM